MEDVMQMVAALGVVPVLTVPEEAFAEPLAAALIAGGLPLIEVMFRSPCAAAAIARIKKAYPEMAVGAGTVLSLEQVEAAGEAGADFIVAPGLNPQIVKRCQEMGLPVLPGCVTPTEIEAGMALGLTTFKFFPSVKMGGVETITELCGPYSNVRFVTTGGLTLDNMAEYLSSDKVAAVGGGFMAPEGMIAAQDWAGITALCKEAVRRSLGFHLAHVGINGKDATEGERMARRLSDLFGLPYLDGTKSVFAGSLVECCKGKFPGAAGHIAIGTRSVERAAAYLARKGVRLREEFRNVAPDGQWIAAYLEEEFGGFAVHLLKKV